MRHGRGGASGFYASKLYSFIYLCPLGPEISVSTCISHECDYPASVPFALWKGSCLRAPKADLLPEVKVVSPEGHAPFSTVFLDSSKSLDCTLCYLVSSCSDPNCNEPTDSTLEL